MSNHTTTLRFQSTLPRRERLGLQSIPGRQSNFNPRSREGSDRETRNKRSRGRISIHAPAKGATVDSFLCRLTSSISIHAPAKGATYIDTQDVYYWTISIHAPAKGATCKMYGIFDASVFQSTLPRRERLNRRGNTA